MLLTIVIRGFLQETIKNRDEQMRLRTKQLVVKVLAGNVFEGLTVRLYAFFSLALFSTILEECPETLIK